jgi:hypothetical protein
MSETKNNLLKQHCSIETANLLYETLQYYRELVPFTLDMSAEEYADTHEAKRVDAALKKYRDETGAKETYANSMFRGK